MRMNLDEKAAIDSLRRVLDAIEQGVVVKLTAGEVNAVKRILNIDLFAATCRKKEVSEFRKGKEGFRIEFGKAAYPESWMRRVLHHGYFPFQIKKRKP